MSKKTIYIPFFQSSTLFMITGLVLLVIKLVTSATFSWFWVFGTLFFPLWVFLCVIGAMIASVVVAAVISLVIFAIAIIPWILMMKYNEYKDTRRLNKRIKEMSEYSSSTSNVRKATNNE